MAVSTSVRNVGKQDELQWSEQVSIKIPFYYNICCGKLQPSPVLKMTSCFPLFVVSTGQVL